MSSMSPDQFGDGGGPSGSQNYSAGEDSNGRPRMNLPEFVNTLLEKRQVRESKPAKKRGPKPDSKPALTRRQELNRQAQRTHREKKELYIKNLEDDVLRAREEFTRISKHKAEVMEENQQLRQLLAQHGIPITDIPMHSDLRSNPSTGYTPGTSPYTNSQMHGSPSAFTPPLTSNSSAPSASPPVDPAQLRVPGNGMDYEQQGIDFVLALEKPCMQHMPWLLERSEDMDGAPCGHALMASCPPATFSELTPEIPFGYSHVNGELTSGQRTWECPRPDLARILGLSQQLPLNDGQLTPVMAWNMVQEHPKFYQLKPEQFQALTLEMLTQVKCYGFGAVIEAYEVNDALFKVLGE